MPQAEAAAASVRKEASTSTTTLPPAADTVTADPPIPSMPANAAEKSATVKSEMEPLRVARSRRTKLSEAPGGSGGQGGGDEGGGTEGGCRDGGG